MPMENLTRALLMLSCAVGVNHVLAQTTNGVQIDYSTTPPARSRSALFELHSTHQGLLVPRLTTLQRNAISAPANGLLIYTAHNTPGFNYYNGTAWLQGPQGAQGIQGTVGLTGAAGTAGAQSLAVARKTAPKGVWPST